MSVMDARRSTLAWLKYDLMSQASQDFVRLYEVIWNTAPELPPERRLMLARKAVNDLIREDLLEFFRITWRATEPESAVDTRRARELIDDPALWEPPVGDEPVLCLRAKYPEVSYERLWREVLAAGPQAAGRSRVS